MKNKLKIVLIVAVILIAGFFFFGKNRSEKAAPPKEFTVTKGSIEKAISATAVVQPQNRLEMKPPVSGRMDEILVQEGQTVKAGDIVANMSSTERAAILDSARVKDDKNTSQWEDIYKPIPIIAPIDGTVIVSTMQPGQTVVQTDAIIVLSNRLIVQAQVDETDIGRVKEDQKANISLDAYPDIHATAAVEHIYHESKTVNNVTIYQVDVIPDSVPEVFRSGMTANVRIIEESRDNVLTLPLEAVKQQKGESVVWLKKDKNSKPKKTTVTTGLSDEANIEIASGLSEGDIVVVKTSVKPRPKQAGGNNPFMPQQSPRR